MKNSVRRFFNLHQGNAEEFGKVSNSYLSELIELKYVKSERANVGENQG